MNTSRILLVVAWLLSVAAGLTVCAAQAGAVFESEESATTWVSHEYDPAVLNYDESVNVVDSPTGESAGSGVQDVGLWGDAGSAARPLAAAHDSSDSRVAPGSALDDVLPNSGPIPQSLGAASRAEQLARKLNLNVNSPTTRQVLNSLDTDVSSFVSQYRKGSIWRELPGEVAEMSVEDALRHSSTVRKLLIDNRFVK